MNIAVFVSGNGSNLQALIDAGDRGELADGKISLVVCDKPEAYALKRADKANIKTFVLEKTQFDSREEYDKRISEELRKENIEVIVLAGFMRILSADLINEYSSRILNVHPALLPKFKGTHGIKDAWESEDEITGVTVHFVIPEVDAGPVILQKEVQIDRGNDTLEGLEEKIHKIEHEIYPKAVRLFVEGKIQIEKGKVKILE